MKTLLVLFLAASAALAQAQTHYDKTGKLLEWHVEQRSWTNSFNQRTTNWYVTVAEVEFADEIIDVEVTRKPKREIKSGDNFQFRIVKRARREDLVCVADPGAKHDETCGEIIGRRAKP